MLRVGLTLVALVGIALALRSAASDVDEVPWPAKRDVAIAALCVAVALIMASLAWVWLLDRHERRVSLASGFLVSQLGKYVPGGVVQIAGQYDAARRAGVEARSVAVALPVHAMTATVGAGAVASVVWAVVGDTGAWWARALFGVAGLVGFVTATSRQLLVKLMELARRRWIRVPEATAIPSQRAILRSAGAGTLGSVFFGVSYVVMVRPEGDAVAVAAGFVVAFTIGFLALPVPSGLGIREAALVGLLSGYASAANLLAAAIGLRVVQLGVELVLAGGSAAIARREGSSSG